MPFTPPLQYTSAQTLLDDILTLFRQGTTREECAAILAPVLFNTTLPNDLTNHANSVIFTKLISITFDFNVHLDEESNLFTLSPTNPLTSPPLRSSVPRISLHKKVILKG